MNIVFSLCDGKLASLSPIYVAIVFIMILSFITGLILTYNEKNKKNDSTFVSNNSSTANVITTSVPMNSTGLVSSISSNTQLIDNTIRIETLEGEPVVDTNNSIDVLNVNDKPSKNQDVTITYME